MKFDSIYDEVTFLRGRVQELEAEIAQMKAPKTRHYQLGTHTAKLRLVTSVSR